MSLHYTVRRAFQEGDTWYTRENADEIKHLPRDLRDELIRTGTIEESDVPERLEAPAPASPAPRAGKGGANR